MIFPNWFFRYQVEINRGWEGKSRRISFRFFSSIHESTEREFIGEIIYPWSKYITFKPKALLFLSVLQSYNSITESIKRFSVFIHKVHNVQNSVSGSIGVPDKNMYIDLNTIILDSIVSWNLKKYLKKCKFKRVHIPRDRQIFQSKASIFTSVSSFMEFLQRWIKIS